MNQTGVHLSPSGVSALATDSSSSSSISSCSVVFSTTYWYQCSALSATASSTRSLVLPGLTRAARWRWSQMDEEEDGGEEAEAEASVSPSRPSRVLEIMWRHL